MTYFPLGKVCKGLFVTGDGNISGQTSSCDFHCDFFYTEEST